MSMLLIKKRDEQGVPTEVVLRNGVLRENFKTVCDTPSMTKQSDKDACDVNKIMRVYEKTGVITADQKEMFFADVAEAGDFREALHRVEGVSKFFSNLPAKVRAEFDNNPAAFLDFCADPESHDRLIELELIEDDRPDVVKRKKTMEFIDRHGRMPGPDDLLPGSEPVQGPGSAENAE